MGDASEFPNLPKRWFKHKDFRLDLSEVVSLAVASMRYGIGELNVRLKSGAEIVLADIDRTTAVAFFTAFDSFHGIG